MGVSYRSFIVECAARRLRSVVGAVSECSGDVQAVVQASRRHDPFDGHLGELVERGNGRRRSGGRHVHQVQDGVRVEG